MQSYVYFIAVNQKEDIPSVKQKLVRLIEVSKVLDCLRTGDNAVIKIHFGEEGNTGYVRPEYARVICDAITKKQAKAFLADTNTLYHGRRVNSLEHRKLAAEHGFSSPIVGAPVVIPDDSKKENVALIKINQRFIKVAEIAKIFQAAQTIVSMAHFKGHLMTGFGGALKNIGMGCATRKGKMAQHGDISPMVFTQNCVGCAACQSACPVKAISLKNKKAQLDNSRCIGCASCIAACNYEAIDLFYEAGADTLQQKMVEYALAVLQGKEKKCAFFNFALKITQECDCLAKDDPRIAPDIGILASSDPVSVDKACLDLINKTCGRDIFKKAHPKRDGFKQLEYAAELGLGNLDYQLVEL